MLTILSIVIAQIVMSGVVVMLLGKASETPAPKFKRRKRKY